MHFLSTKIKNLICMTKTHLKMVGLSVIWGDPMWSPVICSSKYMSIHINLWHLLVCSGDHTGAMVAGDNRLSPTAAAAETAPTGLC